MSYHILCRVNKFVETIYSKGLPCLSWTKSKIRFIIDQESTSFTVFMSFHFNTPENLTRLSAFLSKVLTHLQIQVSLTKFYDLNSRWLALKRTWFLDELYLASVLWCISWILWELSIFAGIVYIFIVCICWNFIAWTYFVL